MRAFPDLGHIVAGNGRSIRERAHVLKAPSLSTLSRCVARHELKRLKAHYTPIYRPGYERYGNTFAFSAPSPWLAICRFTAGPFFSTHAEHRRYVDTYGDDMPGIRNWRWSGARGEAQPGRSE